MVYGAVFKGEGGFFYFWDSDNVGILGPYLDDKKVLDVAEVYEQATDWHEEKPKL